MLLMYHTLRGFRSSVNIYALAGSTYPDAFAYLAGATHQRTHRAGRLTYSRSSQPGDPTDANIQAFVWGVARHIQDDNELVLWSSSTTPWARGLALDLGRTLGLDHQIHSIREALVTAVCAALFEAAISQFIVVDLTDLQDVAKVLLDERIVHLVAEHWSLSRASIWCGNLAWARQLRLLARCSPDDILLDELLTFWPKLTAALLVETCSVQARRTSELEWRSARWIRHLSIWNNSREEQAALFNRFEPLLLN